MYGGVCHESWYFTACWRIGLADYIDYIIWSMVELTSARKD